LWPEGSHGASAIGFLSEIAGLWPEPFSQFRASEFEAIAELLRSRGNRNSTINRKISALTKLLRAAVEDDALAHVPVFRRLEEAGGALRYFSHEEEETFFAAMQDHAPDYADLNVFLINTGVTPGEAIAIRWDSVVGDRVIIPESSMGLARTLPLTTQARQSLANARHELRGPFCRIEQPRYRLAWNAVKADSEWCDDQAVVPTILRHSCASRLVMQGIDLRVVQYWLGNRNYKSMLRYEPLIRFDRLDLCVAALETAGTL
jgi:integrase